MPFTLAQLQEEHRPWVLRNFGKKPTWNPFLGVIEEVGELAHSCLKFHQKIRGISEDVFREKAADAIADITIYAIDVLNTYDISVTEEYEGLDVGSWDGAPIWCWIMLLDKEKGKLSTFYLDHCYGEEAEHLSTKTRQAVGQRVRKILILLEGAARSLEMEYLSIVETVWKSVQQRNWKANPVAAHLA